MTEPTSKLQRHSDQLLRDFPMVEPDFEAQARAIAARLSAPSATSAFALSTEDLLKAPELAAEPGEPPLPSQVRAAPKSSLAEMARKSLQKNTDEDAAALTKELLAAAAQTRRPSADLVERVRAAGLRAPTSTPLPSSEPRRERNSGVVSRAEAPAAAAAVVAPAAAAAKPSNDRRGAFIGIAGVGLALAACVALYLKSSEPASPTSAALAAQQAADGAARAAAPKPASAPPLAAANKPEDVLSPEALKAAPDVRNGDSERALALKGATAALAPAAAKGASATAVGAAAKQPVVLEDDPAPPQGEPKPKAEPPPEPVLKPAEGNSGDVPLSPSAGAVSTALGAVGGGGGPCLGGPK